MVWLAMADDAQDHRDYFRIDDIVAIEYQLMPELIAPGAAAFPFSDTSEQFQLITEMQTIEAESQQILRSIHEQDRQVANYLKNIDRRIQLLSRIIAACSEDIASLPRQSVNLSEGGIAFSSSAPLPKGGYIAIKLVLFPSYAGMLLSGQIVSCEEANKTYTNHITFECISDSDRQLLAKHVIQFQAQQRRARLDQSV